MLYTSGDYAQAIWEYETRTLASGTAGTPSSLSEEYAAEIWTYNTRTLTVPLIIAGEISFVSSGPNGIYLEETIVPSGGTPPISRQWQRSEGGGSYSNLSLQTGIALYDEDVVEGVVYRYRSLYEDSVSESGTSNIITAEVYMGGELSQSTTGSRRVTPRYIGF